MGVRAPGVYIEEIPTLSYSINSAPTAVPVFVVGQSSSEHWWDAKVGPVKLRSFNDYISYANPSAKSSVMTVVSPNMASTFLRRKRNSRLFGPPHRALLSHVTTALAGSQTKTTGANAINPDESGRPWNRVFAPALKAYFDNGGGYCYICPRDKLDLVEGLTDVTLIVQCGQFEATTDILKLCQPGSGRFALLDFPLGDKDEDKFEETLFNGEDFQKKYDDLTPSDCAAVYYPWLKANWTLPDKDENMTSRIHHVAPSAVAAGLICKTDNQIGPWKAPANVALSAGLTPAVKIGDTTQAAYTSADNTTASVNMIRSFSGKGTLVWGGRTLTTGGSNWSYINVRRTFDMAERDISVALQAVLFEANGPATWEAVRAAIDNYLFNLWKKGALQGEVTSQAYFIHIGEGVTMTRDDINQGYLKVRIGLAVVRPAEFVILEFTQQVVSVV